MNRAILTSIFVIVMLIPSVMAISDKTCLIGSVFAFNSDLTARNICYKVTTDNRFIVEMDIENSANVQKTGLVELQPRQGDFLSFVEPVEESCQTGILNERNVHKDFIIDAGDTVNIRLKTPRLPKAFYDLYLVSTNQCCILGSCNQIPPFGWQTKIANDLSNDIISTPTREVIECRFDFECENRYPNVPSGRRIVCANAGTTDSQCVTQPISIPQPQPPVDTGEVEYTTPVVDVYGNDVIVTTTITNNKNTALMGLVELQPRIKSLALAAFTAVSNSCNPDDPQNVHGLIELQPGESVDVRLASEDLRAGTYDLYLVSTNQCCILGSCNAIDPFKWQTKIKSNLVIEKPGTEQVECNFDFECTNRLGQDAQCVNQQTPDSYCSAVSTPGVAQPTQESLNPTVIAIPIFVVGLILSLTGLIPIGIGLILISAIMAIFGLM